MEFKLLKKKDKTDSAVKKTKTKLAEGKKKKITKMPPNTLFSATVLILFAIMIIGQTFARQVSQQIKEVSYIEFTNYRDGDQIETVYLSPNAKEFRFKLKEEDSEIGTEVSTEAGTNTNTTSKEIIYKTQNPKYEDFKKDLLEAGIDVKEGYDTDNITSYVFSALSILVMLLFFSSFRKQLDGGGDFSAKSAKENDKSIMFDNVAGLDEVKADLMTIVDFLKEPEKYKEAGAKIPKGILFYGPPGTGKTLLAKAIANEAGVEFMAVSGAEFEERFVGVGAQRVRKLFADAKKKSPCIIFIDEIDALGSKRKDSNSSTDKQCINQLLTEMDGFSTDDNIMVIAATNRYEDLDPALVRAGRFGKHFAIPLPVNSSDRRKIIDIHSANKNLGNDVDLDLLSKETLGCSPSDIENILNEAAIMSVKENDGVISKSLIDEAFFKQVMNGHKKKDMERKHEEIRITAYHEAAHALVGILLNQEVTKVTIIPSTSGAGGVTFFNLEKLGMYSKKELYNKIKSLYAGRAAEQIVFGEENTTTGASSDIKEATKIISSIIKEYGMSKFGLLDLNHFDIDKTSIMDAANTLSDILYRDTCKLLTKEQKKLELIANTLIEKETLTGDEVKELIYGKKQEIET